MSSNSLEIISNLLSFSDLKFNSIQDCPRPILTYYSGFLPVTKQARHLLSVVKLTGWVSPEIDRKILGSIYKKDPQATHDICCIYKKETSKQIRLLFDFQIKTNDINAKNIGFFLAQAMIKCQSNDVNYLLEERSYKFWREIAAVKLLFLDRSAKLL